MCFTRHYQYQYPNDTINQEKYVYMDSTMSIIVALYNHDNIVLATDSQLNHEESTNGTVEKITINGWQKLDFIGNMGIASISNVGGYEARIIDLVKQKNPEEEIQKTTSYISLTEQVLQELNEDLSKLVTLPSVTKDGNYDKLLMFVMTGFDNIEKPRIHHILWNNELRSFICRPINMPCYISGGITALGWYWLKRIKIGEFIKSSNLQTLKRLASFIICESAKAYQPINDDIQMLSINKFKGLEIITRDEIQSLKQNAEKIADRNFTLLQKQISEK